MNHETHKTHENGDERKTAKMLEPSSCQSLVEHDVRSARLPETTRHLVGYNVVVPPVL